MSLVKKSLFPSLPFNAHTLGAHGMFLLKPYCLTFHLHLLTQLIIGSYCSGADANSSWHL